MNSQRNPFRYFLYSGALVTLAALSSCKKDDDHKVPHNEGELITTFRLTVVNAADTTEVKEIEFFDGDGPGGINGYITPDTLRLLPGMVYKGSIQVLDESIIDATKDLTPEILEEGTDHQLFYLPTSGLNLTISNLDPDENNKPLGLKADLTTGAASRGALRISLNHYDGVVKDGVTPSGETDIEVSFPVKIGN